MWEALNDGALRMAPSRSPAGKYSPLLQAIAEDQIEIARLLMENAAQWRELDFSSRQPDPSCIRP
jgi:ankyrin repeat protein